MKVKDYSVWFFVVLILVSIFAGTIIGYQSGFKSGFTSIKESQDSNLRIVSSDGFVFAPSCFLNFNETFYIVAVDSSTRCFKELEPYWNDGGLLGGELEK